MKMETVSLSVSFRKKHTSLLGYFMTKDALEYLTPHRIYWRHDGLKKASSNLPDESDGL